MSALDAIARTGLQILLQVWPRVERAIASGVDASSLAQSILASIDVSERIAVARVEARHGGPVSEHLVAAVHLEDAAQELEGLGLKDDAGLLREVAKRYRSG